MPGMAAAPVAQEPRRHLNVIDAAAIFGGIVLGSGIFVAPAAVASAAPGVGWAAGAARNPLCIHGASVTVPFARHPRSVSASRGNPFRLASIF